MNKELYNKALQDNCEQWKRAFMINGDKPNEVFETVLDKDFFLVGNNKLYKTSKERSFHLV